MRPCVADARIERGATAKLRGRHPALRAIYPRHIDVEARALFSAAARVTYGDADLA